MFSIAVHIIIGKLLNSYGYLFEQNSTFYSFNFLLWWKMTIVSVLLLSKQVHNKEKYTLSTSTNVSLYDVSTLASGAW